MISEVESVFKMFSLSKNVFHFHVLLMSFRKKIILHWFCFYISSKGNTSIKIIILEKSK